MSRIRSLCLYAVLCFGTGLLACVLQLAMSTARGETNLALIFDSGHYQYTADLIVGAIRAHAVSFDLIRSIKLDGPILPGLGALALMSLGQLFSLSDWQCFLSIQFFLHALSAVLVFLLGRQFFSGSNKWSLAAGLTWAVYPAAILASQRFLVETLACALVLALVLLCSWSITRTGREYFLLTALAGFVSTLILFVKAALAPAAALTLMATLFFTLRQQPALRRLKPILFSCALAAGILVVTMPWAIITGKWGDMQFFPQRAPVLNLFVGWDFENDGYSTLPVAPYSKDLLEDFTQSKSPTHAVLHLWQKQPVKSFTLALKKVTRLYSLPWNDFRRGCFFLSARLLTAIHLSILFLAIAAFALVCRRGAGKAMILSAIVIAGHFIFIVFESIPRYAFSSYPLLLLFALYAIYRLAPPRVPLRLPKLAALAAIAAVSTAWALLARYEPAGEIVGKLGGGEVAERAFFVGDNASTGKSKLLLIDGTRDISGCTVMVNGRLLSQHPQPLPTALPDSRPFAGQVAAFMGRTDADVRAWWFVPVDTAFLNSGKDNTFSIKAAAGTNVRIFGESKSFDPKLRPGYLYYSPGKMWTSNESFEWRSGRPPDDGMLSGHSTINGLPCVGDGNWRMLLVDKR